MTHDHLNQTMTDTPLQWVLPMVPTEGAVVVLDEIIMEQLQELLSRFGMQLELVPEGRAIPGSYWGDSEAGLIGSNIYARIDTPVHSILHEASHYVCMDDERRAVLHRDAGGDYDEENAVCYMQILLADQLIGYNRKHMLQDMDVWGYTFRLGSARAWFENESQDARQWLINTGLLNDDDSITWQIRH